MTTLQDLIADGRPVPGHQPWPRVLVTRAQWECATDWLAEGGGTLVSLWGEPETVHMAISSPDNDDLAVFSLACESGTFPSVSREHAPALRLERAIQDLYGLRPEGLQDTRPWLDHGRWDARQPLARAPATGTEAPPYPFLTAEGDGLHQIPVGPVHAGIIEPGHFRFTASGETVVRLEQRLGYTHRGVEGLMCGADLETATTLAARVCGDSTVAFSLAFARAVEAAVGMQAPPRAAWLRALMAELERLANHLGDIGAICNDAAFALMHAHCGMLREDVLRACDAIVGHRLMQGCIVPGGVSIDLTPQAPARLGTLVAAVRSTFPNLVELYDNTASLQDRTVGTGILHPELARQYGAGGFIGRASGRAVDARRTPGYPPYDRLEFDVPMREAGDVDARVWIRIHEVEQSLGLVEQILAGLPDGPVRTAIPQGAGEGLALVEGFRGDVLVWLRVGEDGRITRCHLRDPSWFQWPLLEAIIEGNIVADFPLCNKSFNCAYSGHDL